VTGPSGTFTPTTDSDGNYSSTRLRHRSYTLDGSTAVRASDRGVSLTTGNDPATVTVPSGGDATANFGFGTPIPGSISGTVFDNANGNGIQDGGEAGIPNITVTITGPSGTFTVTTDANGNYTQPGLDSGSYTVNVDTNDPDLPA